MLRRAVGQSGQKLPMARLQGAHFLPSAARIFASVCVVDVWCKNGIEYTWPPRASVSAAPTIFCGAQSPPFTKISGCTASISTAGVSLSNQVTMIYTRQRSGHGGAVGERINRPIIPFALAAHGSIGVERQNHGRTGGARLRQEVTWPRCRISKQPLVNTSGRGKAARRSGGFGRADSVFEIGQRPRLHDEKLSNKGHGGMIPKGGCLYNLEAV